MEDFLYCGLLTPLRSCLLCDFIDGSICIPKKLLSLESLQLNTSPEQLSDKSVDGSIAWEVAVSCSTLCASATELAILV